MRSEGVEQNFFRKRLAADDLFSLSGLKQRSMFSSTRFKYFNRPLFFCQELENTENYLQMLSCSRGKTIVY